MAAAAVEVSEAVEAAITAAEDVRLAAAAAAMAGERRKLRRVSMPVELAGRGHASDTRELLVDDR